MIRKYATLVVGMMALAATAAVNDTLLSFSTPGPDRYADGTMVLDGECYALVWRQTGSTFGGFAANGAALGTGCKAVAFVPFAKDGKCPDVVFQIPADAYQDGTFGVYLLDTRLANGKVGGLTSAGYPVAVNGYSATAASVRNVQASEARAAAKLLSAARGMVASEQSAVPVDTPQPRITSIEVVGSQVVLKAKDTVACLKYGAKEVDGDGASVAVQGAAAKDEEITIVAPAAGNGGMYRVERR